MPWLVGWSFFHQHYSFGVSLLLGYYAMLRTGELIGLRSCHLLCESKATKVVVSLGLTKSGKRQGAAESCVVGYDMVVKFLRQWKSLSVPTTSFAATPAHWRSLFSQALQGLQLTHFGFRPYSLRRGGATWWFSRHHSLDKILVQGRWQTPKTARIYINEGLAVLAELQIPTSHPSLSPFLLIFNRFKRNPLFQTLEPPGRKPGSSGGRGSRPKQGQKGRRKSKTFIFYFAEDEKDDNSDR